MNLQIELNKAFKDLGSALKKEKFKTSVLIFFIVVLQVFSTIYILGVIDKQTNKIIKKNKTQKVIKSDVDKNITTLDLTTFKLKRVLVKGNKVCYYYLKIGSIEHYYTVCKRKI